MAFISIDFRYYSPSNFHYTLQISMIILCPSPYDTSQYQITDRNYLLTIHTIKGQYKKKSTNHCYNFTRENIQSHKRKLGEKKNRNFFKEENQIV